MKVLRFVRLVFIIVITSLSLAACNEDSNSTAPIFYIDSSLEEGLIFGGEGGEQFIKFGCSMDWNLQISSPNNDMTWCTPSMTSGKAGNYNVKFTVTKNTDENERFVYVNIFAGTSTITFIITQHKKNTEDDVEKPTISLSQESFNVETRGGIIKVDVESNVQYMIQMPDIDWITEMTDNTKASNSHYFAISENPLLTDRNADILFVTQELDTLATVVIEQRANNFITVNSTEAGSLLGIIGAEHIEDVTGLKVIGDINGNDIVLIKRMTNLINLDLSQSRIVEGGVSYGKKDIHYTIPIYIDDEKHPQVDAYTENDIIGENMFENCNFKSIKLPNSSKKIDARAFKNCLLLKNVNIPKSVNYISWFAFYNCKSLDNVIFENEAKPGIGYNAFARCESLKNIDLPDGISEILRLVFAGCISLEEIKIPSNVTKLYQSLFAGCSSLEHVNMPNNITEIEYGVFSNCKSLKKIDIPKSITEIQGYTFYSCSSLETVIIPENTSAIKEYAFNKCTNLKEIHIKALPTTLKSIHETAFGEEVYTNATLFIPKKTWNDYFLTPLGYFDKYIEE